MVKPIISLIDIETTGLNAFFGYVLCFGYMRYGIDKKPTVLTIDDFPGERTTDDSRLMREVYKVLIESDMWVGWYSKKFDIPFLQTRMMLADRKMILPNTAHLDLWGIARVHGKAHSNRLAAWSERFGWGAKTPVLGQHWVDAMAGYPDARKYVYKHNYIDVKVLAPAYKDLSPLAVTHARLGGYGPCRRGHWTLERRGYATTTTRGTQVRVHCTTCGGWETRPLTDITKYVIKSNS